MEQAGTLERRPVNMHSRSARVPSNSATLWFAMIATPSVKETLLDGVLFERIDGPRRGAVGGRDERHLEPVGAQLFAEDRADIVVIVIEHDGGSARSDPIR